MAAWIARTAVVPCLLAAAPAQTDPAPPSSQPQESAPAVDPEVARLIADLTAAHRGDTAEVRIRAFHGKLAITPTARDQDKITLTIDVRFQIEPTRIRYKVDEGGRRIERGQDRRGKWARLDQNDRAVDLGKAEYEGDRRELAKHVALARALLRFLDPAEVVRSLRGRPTVATEELLVRQEAVRCRTLSGRLAAFPLYTSGGENREADVKLWVRDDMQRLIAVEARPVPTPEEPAPLGEYVFMPEHQLQDAVLLPTKLYFDRLTPDGRREPISKIEIVLLQLNPVQSEASFDRDQPW